MPFSYFDAPDAEVKLESLKSVHSIIEKREQRGVGPYLIERRTELPGLLEVKSSMKVG